MAGTKLGGIKTARTNKSRHGQDFYARIGKLGGAKSRGGGFADRELARRAGLIGGRRSRRSKTEAFFIAEAEIDNHIIETFNKRPWYSGWFKRSK